MVDQLDPGPFLKAYRADGHGRAASAPRILLGVLLYAYCTGIRSSRQIERRCTEDIVFRVLSGNTTPDHVTIARFRVGHEQALAGLLVQSLKLCGGHGPSGVGRLGRHQGRGQRRRGGQPHPRPPRGPGRRVAHPGRCGRPGFGQVKTIQGGGRFMRRGLQACQAEWKLLCGTHNLPKRWRTIRATSS
jgi:hypothetical protein